MRKLLLLILAACGGAYVEQTPAPLPEPTPTPEPLVCLADEIQAQLAQQAALIAQLQRDIVDANRVLSERCK